MVIHKDGQWSELPIIVFVTNMVSFVAIMLSPCRYLMCLVLVSPCRYLACLVPGGSNFGGLLTTTAARPVSGSGGRGSITESIFIGKGQQPSNHQHETQTPAAGSSEQARKYLLLGPVQRFH